MEESPLVIKDMACIRLEHVIEGDNVKERMTQRARFGEKVTAKKGKEKRIK